MSGKKDFFLDLEVCGFFRRRRRIREECGKIVETSEENKNYVNFELTEGNGENKVTRNTKIWI